MKLETLCKVDIDDMLMGCCAQEAMKIVKLADEYQYDCDFTYKVALTMMKRLEKELGKNNEYAVKLKEIL